MTEPVEVTILNRKHGVPTDLKQKNHLRMKKITFLFTILLIASSIQAQPWKSNLPAGKAAGEISLYEYKEAFDAYWAPYNVDRGYYIVNGKKVKAPGWRQFHRWYWHQENQVDYLTGRFFDKTPKQVYDEYKASENYKSSPKSANWVSLGTNSSEGGYAGVGRLNCVAFHPTDMNTFWAGAPAGGIWVTHDGGSSWTCLTNDNGVLGVSDIVIPSDFVTSNTIYIATGDKNANDNKSIGVLKSTDGGLSWNATGLAFNLAEFEMVYRILIDPTDDQTLIAATSNGVFKTIDGGTTWDNQISNKTFVDLEYKPGDFNTLYGSTSNGSIFRTTDGGANWAQVLTSMGAGRVEMAVSPDEPTWVYAIAAASNNGLKGVYKSTDSGETFTAVFDESSSGINLLGWDSNGYDSGGQGWYDLCIAANPTDADIVLVGGVNSWRSVNGGTSWTCINHWWGQGGVQAVHADKHMLKFRDNGDLFECNDGGIYYSNNNGSSGSWVDKTNGMVISQMYKLGVSQTVANETITGLQDNGTKLHSGNIWYDVKGGDGMECLIDYSDVNIQYGTYVNGQISRTTNHWASATDIEPYNAGDGAWVTPYIIDPIDPAVLYAGYSDVWKTTNRGNSWTKISTLSVSNKIRSMAIAPSDNQVLYVASTGAIWKTVNGGTEWSNITGTLTTTNSSITSIVVKNDDPNTLWVTLGGYNAYGVYQSTDGGSSWVNISQGLPLLPMYSIVQNKQSTSDVHLYVGSELGIYFKNGMNDWVSYNTGLPNVKIGELEIYYANQPAVSRLRAATYGRGLWESPLAEPSTGPYIALDPPSLLFENQFVGTISNPKSYSIYGGVLSDDVTITAPEGFSISFEQEGTYGQSLVVNQQSGSIENVNVYVRFEPAEMTNYQDVITHECTGAATQVVNVVGAGVVPVYWVRFTVYAPDEITPIEGATITLNGVNRTTNVNGIASFTKLEAGTYPYTITHPDILPVEKSLELINQSIDIVEIVSYNSVMEHSDLNLPFAVYPNPSNGLITICNPENRDITVMVFDAAGHKVNQQSFKGASTHSLDLQHLSSGMYFVRITGDKIQQNSQIMIK